MSALISTGTSEEDTYRYGVKAVVCANVSAVWGYEEIENYAKAKLYRERLPPDWMIC